VLGERQCSKQLPEMGRAMGVEGAMPEEITSHQPLATSHRISNRYKSAPPGGVPSGLLPGRYTRPSTRYTVRIEIAVTHSKQTTEVFSTRYKKPSPRGVPLELHKTKIRRTVEERQGNSRSLTPIRRRRGWVREDNGRRDRAQTGWPVLISGR